MKAKHQAASQFGALLMAAALISLPSSIAHAQTNPACAGEALPTKFGSACRSHTDLAPITEADYGVVRLHFRPRSPDDVIPDDALRNSYLEGLVARVAAQRVNSAVVLLEVRAVGPGLQNVAGADGSNIGVPLAIVPLALYGFDNRNGVKFNEVQDFADRVIGPRLLLQPDQTIRARVKIAFSQENPASLIASLAPIVNVAAAFGGHGFVVDAFANPALINDLTRIESTLRSVNNTDANSDDWVDLNFEGGANQLTYAFHLNPRDRRGRAAGAPRPLGELTVTLERRPSLFTNDVIPGGAAGRQLPDYHTNGRLDSQATDRIWVDGRVGAGISPAIYVRQNDGLRTTLDLFQSTSTTVPTFDTVCRSLRQTVSQFNLSMHDRTAIFWAAFVQGDNASRYEIQQVNCIKRDRELWASYGFALPQAGQPPPAIPPPTARDDWINYTAAPALSQQDPRVRSVMLRRLFRSQVTINVAPNTIYDPGDEPAPNAVVDSGVLVSALKPLRPVGCRFVRQEPGAALDLPRFSVLGRLPDNRLLVLTIDYGGRANDPNGVEIVGLRVSEPTDDDWSALASVPNVPRRCLRDNMAYAPADPPAAGEPTPH